MSGDEKCHTFEPSWFARVWSKDPFVFSLWLTRLTADAGIVKRMMRVVCKDRIICLWRWQKTFRDSSRAYTYCAATSFLQHHVVSQSCMSLSDGHKRSQPKSLFQLPGVDAEATQSVDTACFWSPTRGIETRAPFCGDTK